MSHTSHISFRSSEHEPKRSQAAPEADKFLGPWFLTYFGMITMDIDRAHNHVKPSEWAYTHPNGNQGDFPVFSAPTFDIIIKYLPRIPSLKSKFERQDDGTMIQTRSIYFIVDNFEEVYKNVHEAHAFQHLIGCKWRSIHAAASRKEASELIEKHSEILFEDDNYA
ncbi:hypothetical protein B0H19DRAFT_1250701 [Mycena capillaripes]|nr:hypothetical protein B0H19DRAFT_1250701 [Mycena capillaripes]